MGGIDDALVDLEAVTLGDRLLRGVCGSRSRDGVRHLLLALLGSLLRDVTRRRSRARGARRRGGNVRTAGLATADETVRAGPATGAAGFTGGTGLAPAGLTALAAASATGGAALAAGHRAVLRTRRLDGAVGLIAALAGASAAAGAAGAAAGLTATFSATFGASCLATGLAATGFATAGLAVGLAETAFAGGLLLDDGFCHGFG